jgi:hypothetical protein
VLYDDADSFSKTANGIRYGYDLEKDRVKFRVFVEEFNDGRKVIDYYSDRNIGTGAPETIPPARSHDRSVKATAYPRFSNRNYTASHAKSADRNRKDTRNRFPPSFAPSESKQAGASRE